MEKSYWGICDKLRCMIFAYQNNFVYAAPYRGVFGNVKVLKYDTQLYDGNLRVVLSLQFKL